MIWKHCKNTTPIRREAIKQSTQHKQSPHDLLRRNSGGDKRAFWNQHCCILWWKEETLAYSFTTPPYWAPNTLQNDPLGTISVHFKTSAAAFYDENKKLRPSHLRRLFIKPQIHSKMILNTTSFQNKFDRETCLHTLGTRSKAGKKKGISHKNLHFYIYLYTYPGEYTKYGQNFFVENDMKFSFKESYT